MCSDNNLIKFKPQHRKYVNESLHYQVDKELICHLSLVR